MRGTKYTIFIFALMTLVSTNASGQVQVFAQAETSKEIYIGESFAYHIIIDGENKAGQVDITPLAKYNPQGTGNRDVSQRSWSLINGKTTEKIVKRYVMSYSLSAQTEGQIDLPPVTVTLNGKKYKTNPVTVNVLKPGTTDKLDLEVMFSQQHCYVGQPVIMTVKFYISTEIRHFQFDIPAFNSNTFYIEEPDVRNPLAREYRLSITLPMTVFATESRVVHNGKDSVLLTFSKVMIPRRSGQIEIEPITVSADVAVGRQRSRDRFFDSFDPFGSRTNFKRFMASAKPMTLTVLPLPEEGKPAGFYGLVGNYTISASAVPTEVYMGDPITLTIKIGGNKYLKPVRWPALEEVPELAANFKIPSQKATPVIENGFKVFTQTIRPDNNQAKVIPSVAIVYFDVEKGKYVTARTEPIQLDLTPSKRLTNKDFEGRDFVPVNKEVEMIKKGLSANYEGRDVLTNMSFSPLAALQSPVYAAIWVLPLAALVLSSLIRFFTHTTEQKTAMRRRQKAPGKATGQLRKVTSSEHKQRPELLALIMKQYIGERFDRTAGSLTAEDSYEIIAAATKDTQTAGKYRDIIARCEAVRYASEDLDIDTAQIKEVIKLIRHIEKKCRK